MAKPLYQGEVQFCSPLGTPYGAGTVGMYVPGTLTPKSTWQDAAETIANANPVPLDAAGRAVIWGTGVYRQILLDVNGVQIWDKIVTIWPDTSELLLPCTATGSNTIALVLGPAEQPANLTHAAALINYQSVAWAQAVTNTTAVVTISFTDPAGGVFGPFPAYKDSSAGPIALAIGDLHAGDLFIANYDQALNAGGGGWHVGGPGLYGIIQNSLVINYQPQIDALAARVLVLEQMEPTFGSDPGSGDHGTAAWIIIKLAPGAGGIMIYWSSESNIAPGTKNVPIRGPAFASSGWIGTAIVDSLPASNDPLLVIDASTKATGSFDFHNYSANSINAEFVLIGGTNG